MQPPKVFGNGNNGEKERVCDALDRLLRGTPSDGLSLRSGSRQLAQALVGHRTESTSVENTERILSIKRIQDDLHGGGLIDETVRVNMQFAVGLLRHTYYTDDLKRRLYEIASDYARLAGWCYFDVGEYHLANRYYRAALRAADEATHEGLRANIQGFIALQAIETGNADKALRRLRRVQRQHKTTLGIAERAALSGRLAIAAASVGERYFALEAADEALAWVALVTPETTPSYVYWVDDSDIRASVGKAFLELGDTALAIEHLNYAIKHASETKVREKSLWLLALACAHFRDHDLGLACKAATEVFPLLHMLYSPRVNRGLREFQQQLRPHTAHPAVRSFNAKASEFLVERDKKYD